MSLLEETRRILLPQRQRSPRSGAHPGKTPRAGQASRAGASLPGGPRPRASCQVVKKSPLQRCRCFLSREWEGRRKKREREEKNRRAFSLSSPSQSSSTLPPLVLALFSSRESAWTHQRSSLWRRTHFPPSLLTRGRRQRAKGERWSLASARRRRCARSPSCSSSPWPRLFRPSPLPREVPCATRRETAWFCTPTRSGRSRTRGEEAWGGGEGGDPFFFEFDRGRSPLTMACSPSGGRT